MKINEKWIENAKNKGCRKVNENHRKNLSAFYFRQLFQEFSN